MFSIFRKEINSFLNSLIGYLVIAVFLTTSGLIFWIFPDTSVLDYGFAEMGTFFSLTPYIFMFLLPAVTMRLFAEERKGGTMELLFTKPITDWQIIGGKYLAACFLVVLAVIPTLLYYVTLYKIGNPQGNIDSAGVFGSYIGLLLLGAVFAAIGVFTSSLTDNQIVAFLIGVFGCFLLYVGIGSLAGLSIWGEGGYWIQQFGLDYHYNALGRGLIDSRNVMYFVSFIALFLWLTKWKLERK
ncbi:MAG: gliding motility-associated ABC transporter permease subunit GldF [Spirosomataceae bacterium]